MGTREDHSRVILLEQGKDLRRDKDVKIKSGIK